MDKRIAIKRDTSERSRQFIAKQIAKSIIDLRGDLPNTIYNLLEEIKFEDTQLRYLPEISVLLRENSINDLLDMFYLDNYVQYSDIFDLQDHLLRLRSLFDSTIISMINRIGELSSRVRDYSTLSDQRFSFTDTIHESFNSQINRSIQTKKLSINPGAGILRLGAQTEEYCTLERSSVRLEPISKNVRIIDETDKKLVYLNDPTEPYYLTLLTNTNPYNQSYPLFAFGDYVGTIVDLIITFTGVYPITRISFAPFSNAPIDIIGAFYSDIPGQTFEGKELIQIALPRISQDNSEIEINFERVFAREIHILLRQDKFLMAEEETEIVETFGVDEYINYCLKSLRSSLPNGFHEVEDSETQVNELLKEVKNRTKLPVERLSSNTKSYVLGVYNLKAFNAEYNVYGEYESISRSLMGNLSAVSLAFDGEIYRSSSENTHDTTTLFTISTGDRDVYLGVPVTERVIDAVTLVVNENYTQGLMIPSSTHLYKFRTHFIPDEDKMNELKIYADGEELVLPEISSSGLVVNKLDYGISVEIPTAFAMDNGIYDGSILTVEYPIADVDRFGRSYSISSVDILGTLGKPNIADNTTANVFSKYIYTVERDEVGVVEESASYEETEYTPIIVSGEVYYCIYDGKGEDAGYNIITIGTKKYVNAKYVVGPFDDFYYGSIREVPTHTGTTVIDGSNYNTFESDIAYVKGTLKVFKDGYYVSGVEEYETDVLPGPPIVLEQKRKFYVPQTIGTSVTISYIPIDSTKISKYVDSNISQHNFSEKFPQTRDKRITLSRYPYVDRSIVTSPTFDFSHGLFSLKYKYSVVYEPIVVYVNGVKATNITEYRTGESPTFWDKRRETDYQFYIDRGNTIIFNEDLTGNIVVYYYVVSDSFSTKVEMYRSNYYRNDLSPELYNYTILANVQR